MVVSQMIVGQVIVDQMRESPAFFISFFRNGNVVAQTLPCPRSNLGYPKSEFRFGTSQTGISIWDDLSQV